MVMIKKTIMFTCFVLFASIANCGNYSSVVNKTEDGGGGGDDDPWRGKGKIPKKPISIAYQSPTITLINATSNNDVIVSVIDIYGSVVHSEVIKAEETSYFTIYVGDLLSGTYQLVLNIDGDDFLSWPFEIIN